MRTLNETKSFCNICFKVIPACTFIKDGRVFIEKNCEEHGKFVSDHAWDDPEIYAGLSKINSLDASSAQVSVALTYKCNLNCPVCYARANEDCSEDFTIANLKEVLSYKKIYLTGGEPTIRKDLSKIISYLKNKNKSVSLFSNGVRLANRSYLESLKKAGLSSVTLQFDTINENDSLYIRGKNLNKVKIKAIENLEELQIPVLLYSVIIKGKNYKDMKGLVDFGLGFKSVRAIGVNPLWRIGRYDKKDFVPSSKIINGVCNAIGVKKSDWVESTALLCNLDKFLSFFYPRKRYYSKCMTKCLLLLDKGSYIPITQVFDVKKINQKIEAAYAKKSIVRIIAFLVYFFIDQVIKNYIINRNFRIFVSQTIRNFPYLIKNKVAFFIPFRQVSLAIFPTKENLDFNFIKDCNFKAVSSEDLSMRPACIHRIFALEKQGK